MPLNNPQTPVVTGTPTGTLGLMMQSPASVSSGYSWTYSTNAKPFPAYTANVQNVAYTGSLLDLSQAGRLTDVNSLRVAYENLRVFTENLAQQHNAISLDLKAAGIINT